MIRVFQLLIRNVILLIRGKHVNIPDDRDRTFPLTPSKSLVPGY